MKKNALKIESRAKSDADLLMAATTKEVLVIQKSASSNATEVINLANKKAKTITARADELTKIISRSNREAKDRCNNLINAAEKEASSLRNAAALKSSELISEAEKKLSEAQIKASQILNTAQSEADKMRAETERKVVAMTLRGEQSVNRSGNRSGNRSVNPSTSQPINQSPQLLVSISNPSIISRAINASSRSTSQ